MAQRPAAVARMVAVSRSGQLLRPTVVGWATLEHVGVFMGQRTDRRMVRSAPGFRLDATPHRVDRAARLVAGEEQDVSLAPLDPIDRAWWHLHLSPEILYADQRIKSTRCTVCAGF